MNSDIEKINFTILYDICEIITSTLCADIFNLITKNNLPKKVDYFL